MTSTIDICNRALDLVTTNSTIASLTEGTPEANVCSRWFDRVRDQLLRAAHWNFAKKTATLALLKQAPGTPGAPPPVGVLWDSSYPPPPWLYLYAIPNDCLLVRYVLGQGGGSSAVPIFGTSTSNYPVGIPSLFETQAEGIVTNAPKALAVYTRKVENPEFWDAQFIVAMEHALASMIAPTLTGDSARARALLELANGAITEARVSDANEGLTILDHTPDWIQVRLGGTAQHGFVAPYGPMLIAGV